MSEMWPCRIIKRQGLNTYPIAGGSTPSPSLHYASRHHNSDRHHHHLDRRGRTSQSSSSIHTANDDDDDDEQRCYAPALAVHDLSSCHLVSTTGGSTRTSKEAIEAASFRLGAYPYHPPQISQHKRSVVTHCPQEGEREQELEEEERESEREEREGPHCRDVPPPPPPFRGDVPRRAGVHYRHPTEVLQQGAVYTSSKQNKSFSPKPFSHTTESSFIFPEGGGRADRAERARGACEARGPSLPIACAAPTGMSAVAGVVAGLNKLMGADRLTLVLKLVSSRKQKTEVFCELWRNVALKRDVEIQEKLEEIIAKRTGECDEWEEKLDEMKKEKSDLMARYQRCLVSLKECEDEVKHQKMQRIQTIRSFQIERHTTEMQQRENHKLIVRSLKSTMIETRRRMRLKNFCLSVWLHLLFRNRLAAHHELKIQADNSARELEEIKKAITCLWTHDSRDKKLRRLVRSLTRVLDDNDMKNSDEKHLVNALMRNYARQIAVR